MPKFFIDRPVFAWVIAIIIMLSGMLAIKKLPIEQYPNIAPPSVAIQAVYPGADAKTVENSVTQVIEQSLTGIDNLRYFNSSSSDGSASITLTFEPGTNPDIAQVQTQNKIQSVVPQLPSEAQSQGITVSKSNESFLLVAGFYSEDSSFNEQELGDLLSSKIQDPIARINGVGSVTVFGEPHAMRIWLNPHKMFSYGVTTLDVKKAISIQNADVSAGQLGGLPAVVGQELNATITAQSLLRTPEEFEDILIRVNEDGSKLKLKDIARIELGSEGYNRIVRYKRLPASGLAVSLASGANALDTSKEVKAKIAELAKVLPKGIKVIYPYDTTPFIELSIKNVIKTLIEAVGLVFLVMLLFLQNFRATLIPTIAVPVVLLGTFAILSAFGFTINVLTMFAMVLAIGLLVDDAIVVVENVERLMADEGLSPREATRKSMEQITFVLIGIAIVLSAVFVPMAFFGGSAGAIYRQFSITIVSAMLLSVIVALVLSPSLCATILKPIPKNHSEARTGFFGWFNRNFNKTREAYQKSCGFVISRTKRFFVIYGALFLILIVTFLRLPTSFLPNEDQGIVFIMLNTPPGATAERTLNSVKQAENFILTKEKNNVEHLFTVVGFSFAGAAQNTAIGFVRLKDWDERKKPDQAVFSIANRLMGFLMSLKDAFGFAYFPPPIRELGNASGFDLELIDRAGLGHEALIKARNQVLGMSAQNPKLTGVRPNGLDDIPQYKITIDTNKAQAMGISIDEIHQTLETAWGSSYVGDFLDQNRIKKVYIQADAPYRMLPNDMDSWYVRNNRGDMVPFSSFITSKWDYGSPKLERFNGSASVNILGTPAPGVSTGEAMQEIEKIVAKLPPGFAIEWSGLSYEERLSSAQAPMLYALSILVVFLCLAALYESWLVPFAVILTVPLGILGVAIAANIKGLHNDIYLQVALLTTVGLSAKNAILIVEFAKDLYQQGHSAIEAALIAAKLRFRPIIMTSMALICGVTPLAIAYGAGSASQNSIGIGVMGGMIAATTIAIFFVPMFYVSMLGVAQKIFKNK